MDPFERIQCIVNGETPDKPAVWAATGLRMGSPGGVFRRLLKRGLGLRTIEFPYTPFFAGTGNPYLEDVEYQVNWFNQEGVWKVRHTYRTPVGEVHSVLTQNIELGVGDSPSIHFVKEPGDWKVVNFIFRRILDRLKPNYRAISRLQDEMGESGYVMAVVDKSPYQRSWIELASLMRTVVDCKEEPAEFLEYLDLQIQLHQRIAEITAECPTDLVLINDNITNTISPQYYRKFCSPVYKIYQEAFQGTGKALAVHHDGLLRDLREEIELAPFTFIDSLTIPPTGDVSLSEVKEWWPDKLPIVNLPPHLAFVAGRELRDEYERLLEEWGSNRLIFVHVEDFPPEQVEEHLAALLDVCGYDG